MHSCGTLCESQSRRSCRLTQPRVPRADDRLRTISYLQLAEDVRDMIAHRFQAERELLGDLRVAAALRDQREHLRLALGQLREDARRPARAAGGEEAEQPSGDAWT